MARTRTTNLVSILNRDLVEQSVRFSQAFLRRFGRSRDGAPAYPRLRVLESLHCNGPARMRDLGDYLGVPARNLTTLADALESDQLICRTPHPSDGRVTLLTITAAGSTALTKAWTSQLEEISALFDSLPERDKRVLLAALIKLSAALESSELVAAGAQPRKK